MSFKLSSWNIEGRLSTFALKGRGTPDHILSEIMHLNADVIVLPEASDGSNLASHIKMAITAKSYKIFTATYKDSGTRKYPAVTNPTIMLLSRLPVKNVCQTRDGDIRTLLTADITDPDTGYTYRLFCIHLDDRSEKNRLIQIKNLLKEIEKSTYPVILAGDFNSMHKRDYKARLLKGFALKNISRLIPGREVRDKLERLFEMAEGSSLDQLESKAGLRDADKRHQPTTTAKMRGQLLLPSLRLVQLDHIFVGPTVKFLDFKVSSDGGSDHRAISVIVDSNPSSIDK